LITTLILSVITAASVFSFVAIGADKLLAKDGISRISTPSLWLFAFFGGFLGVLAGGYLFRHRTEGEILLPAILAAVFWLWLLFVP